MDETASLTYETICDALVKLCDSTTGRSLERASTRTYVLEEMCRLADAWPERSDRDAVVSLVGAVSRVHELDDELSDGVTAGWAQREALEILRGLATGTVDETAVARVADEVSRQLEDRRGGDGAGDSFLHGNAEFLDEFVSEASEHLDLAASCLLNLEESPNDQESLNGLFRSIHTIKGVAAFLGLDSISQLTHHTENLLQDLRDGKARCDDAVVDVLFEVCDRLKSLTTEAGATGGRVVSSNDLAELMGRVSRVAAEARVRDRSAGDLESLDAATAAVRESYRSDDHSVKVDARRLDSLLDSIGELVVAVSVADGDHDDLAAEKMMAVRKITRQVQEVGMSLRMVPLLATMRKIRRLVRDLSKRFGKPISFEHEGGEIELDRSIVDQIQDALVHIVRNAIDHGLEAASEREAAGKSRIARISFRAFQRGGNIFVEIRDDGRGIDADAVHRKAVERGLIGSDESLTREEALALVFRPGFSTAAEVTSISGRGVGMDVVRETVDQLRGRVTIRSEVGRGTTVLLRLPLTVAMIEGMIIRVGKYDYIIPTLSMRRAVPFRPEDISTVANQAELLRVQDELIPLIRLREVLGISAGDECSGGGAREDAGTVIISESEGAVIGLLADDLTGQQQIVVKTLGEGMQAVPGVSGGAVMPDGRVGLILDVPGVIQLHRVLQHREDGGIE